MNLAKVTTVKSLVKIRRYKLCSGVAAYYVKSVLVCMQCVVQNETQSHSALHTVAAYFVKSILACIEYAATALHSL